MNGATNIYNIAYNAINNKARPNYVFRSNNLSGFLEELLKIQFTCVEIGNLEVSFHFIPKGAVLNLQGCISIKV